MRMKENNYIIPIAQLCHTTLIMTNITASSTSNIHNIQLDETPVDTETEDSLSSNEEVEAQVQTKNIQDDVERGRQQNAEHIKCINVG